LGEKMKYTFVRQHDATDCAAACLAMICLHYKKETTITKLRDLMGTDIKGTNIIGLKNAVMSWDLLLRRFELIRKVF